MAHELLHQLNLEMIISIHFALCTVVISHAAAHDSWLEKHRFWKREAWMENHHGLKELIEDFRLESVDDYHNKDDKGTAICRIFSRKVRATKMDAM